jgi:peptidoglycan hydrolase CwlO-like protein
MSGAPLDELIEAINEVVGDIERKTERAHSEYDDRTAEHNSEVSRINSEIDSANADIAHTTEFLNNVLYV